ncbi:uncharacterized protein C24H6.02c-like [Monomorium pharaonis]|uniref:uncharacterized protein C24H6.02c-like n=1 Tax=Monomorium pharaonis TaxID=307658 RepID=UPI00063F56ED|nr:uncharacterized protein C24H6.02c-like [Monomorium pharaonis]
MMLSIRQALRLSARVACNQRVVACYQISTLHEPSPSGIGALRTAQVRLAHENGSERRELAKLEGKMRLMFTCKKCGTRTSKLISKLAYNKGVVIVRCDGCKNNHLIADNLGWFSEINNRINIEKLMELKGETVRKIMNDVDGYYEAISKEEFKLPSKDTSEMKSDENKIKINVESKGS